MASQTITCTLPPAPATGPNYFEAADELSILLDQHQLWDDSLSKSLLRWGNEVLRTVVAHSNATHEAISVLAQERIHTLATKILINPLDNSPLREPVLERDWVWERWMLGECRRLFPNSPLDDQPMSSDPPIHEFAAKLIAWMHRLSTSHALVLHTNPAGNLDESQLALLGDSPAAENVKRFTYQRLAQAARVVRQNKDLQERMDYVLAHADQFIVQVKERDQQVLAEAQRRADAHEAALQERIASLNETHQSTVDGLNAQINAMEERHRANLADLEARLAAVDQTNTQTCTDLRSQIQALQQQHTNNLAAVQQEITRCNQEHQQVAARLQTELTNTTHTHQDAMNSLTQTHQRTVTGLQTQIAENVASIRETNSRLIQAEAQNTQNAQEAQRLRSELAQANQEIARLRQEVADADDGCTVM